MDNTPTQEIKSNSNNTALMPSLDRNFDHKSASDWLIVGVMSIPLVVLSIFGVLYLLQLANIKN